MRNGIPVIYWIFRMAWTVLHLVIVAAVAAAVFTVALADDNAARAWQTSKSNVLDVQREVADVIPWPWSGDDDGGDDSDASSSDDEASGSTDAGVTLSIQVESNLNVRQLPTSDSDVVEVLDAGSWVEADCKVDDGALVEEGPYAPSTRWTRVEGLGYVSDAYVATVTDELPTC